jgi:hypothetical protein
MTCTPCPRRRATLSTDVSIRACAPVEIGCLIDQIELLEQDGPHGPDGERMLLARHRDTGVGRRRSSSVVVLRYPHTSLVALVASEFTLQNQLGLASLTGVNYLQN